MFKVIIAGGRDFNNYNLLKEKCLFLLQNKFTEGVTVISGHARGADMVGEQFAKEFNLNLEIFPADWETNGKSAGYIRNAEMLKHADAVICFWDGKSKGTKHMIDITKKANKPLKVIKY